MLKFTLNTSVAAPALRGSLSAGQLLTASKGGDAFKAGLLLGTLPYLRSAVELMKFREEELARNGLTDRIKKACIFLQSFPTTMGSFRAILGAAAFKSLRQVDKNRQTTKRLRRLWQ